MNPITSYLEEQSILIEQKLNQLLPIPYDSTTTLIEAARYALLNGGKRLRPILALTTTRVLQGDISLALKPACILEIIHTYSMIHDDLPCMDNDDYRRGQLTVHRKYTEGHAVLTGDFLLTYAFELLATDSLLCSDTKIALLSALTSHIGHEGMIGGQVMDIAYENQTISLEKLRVLHHNKTAALLIASLEFGAIIAKATPLQFNCLRQFGEKIGLAFQIIDDILDVTSSEIKHGKALSSDVLNEKSTYVSLLGLEQAKSYAQSSYQQAIQALKPLACDTSLLRGIADFMIQRTH
jgi:geranylgeranyl diphosphate synthase type II